MTPTSSYICGECSVRSTRLRNLPCATCRRKNGPTSLCMPSKRGCRCKSQSRFSSFPPAVTIATIAYLSAAMSTSSAAGADLVNETMAKIQTVDDLGHEKAMDLQDLQMIDIDNCNFWKPWRAVIGTTLAVSLVIVFNDRLSQGRSTESPKSKMKTPFALQLVTAALLLAAFIVIFPSALQLLKDENREDKFPSKMIFVRYLAVGTSTLLGFFLPVVLAKLDVKQVNSFGDSTTVFDEEQRNAESSYLMPECNSSQNPTSATLLSRSMKGTHYIGFNNKGANDSQIGPNVHLPTGTKQRNLYLFTHGVFVGIAILSSCSFHSVKTMIVSLIALLHGTQQHIDSKNASIGSMIGSAITVFSFVMGGSSVLLIGFCKCLEINAIILAVASGLYMAMFLSQIQNFVKRFGADSSVTSFQCDQVRSNTYQYSVQTSTCMPCNEIVASVQQRSKAISMPKSFRNESVCESSALKRHYDGTTWNMYNRIMTARKARARCEICMGVFEDDKPSNVMIGKVHEEVDQLISTCPSKLFTESDSLNETESSVEQLMAVHQDCYYGATGEYFCPRTHLKSEDNFIFHLDL
ncbi:hypothetical protein ACHAXS_005223 [Conticribra weissflogii]